MTLLLLSDIKATDSLCHKQLLGIVSNCKTWQNIFEYYGTDLCIDCSVFDKEFENKKYIVLSYKIGMRSTHYYCPYRFDFMENKRTHKIIVVEQNYLNGKRKKKYKLEDYCNNQKIQSWILQNG